MSNEIQIIVDIHEEQSEVFDRLVERDFGTCTMKHLEVGDIILEYKGYTVGIEVKRGSDLHNSLKSGRLHSQLARCTEQFDFPILIIEDFRLYVSDSDDEYSIKEKMRKHKMGVRTLNRRVATFETKHIEESIDLIGELCRDLKLKKINVIRRPVIVEAEISGPMKIICSLPHVKYTIGERVLNTYGCVQHALDDIDKWEDIDGIGSKKLARIKDTLMEGEYL